MGVRHGWWIVDGCVGRSVVVPRRHHRCHPCSKSRWELEQIERRVHPRQRKGLEGPLCTNRGRGWEAFRLRLSNIFISNSFGRIRGEQRNSVVVSRIIVPGLGRTGRLGNSGHEATLAVHGLV